MMPQPMTFGQTLGYDFLVRYLALLVWSTLALGVRPDLKKLPITLAPQESIEWRDSAPLTGAPVGPVRSLAEWETSTGVMTLWTNASLLRALSDHGPVKLLADTRADRNWWLDFLDQNGIKSERFTFFEVPTDSIWIRDYGPWFILDGNYKFGLIDTKYNRPRPLDDKVPVFIAKQMGIPYYQPGLVHTGGNYYSDALGNAFSSTLAYSENANLSQDTVKKRMHDFLGIDRYTTSRLSPGSTIEHLDTFGKLVTPDTWVFSAFPAGSEHKADSDRMAALLATLKSPYGTPYRVLRLKMYSQRSTFRAYLNSFISNHTLYFPAYGDSIDEEARLVYQRALPGYDIVGVDAQDTEWGDSVHCRTRNLLTDKTVFIFPHIEVSPGQIEVTANIIPSSGSELSGAPTLSWNIDGTAQAPLSMEATSARWFERTLSDLKRGTTVSFWIKATDLAGYSKTEPHGAPELQISVLVE